MKRSFWATFIIGGVTAMLRLIFWVVVLMTIWALFHNGIAVTVGGQERIYKVNIFHKPVLGR